MERERIGFAGYFNNFAINEEGWIKIWLTTLRNLWKSPSLFAMEIEVVGKTLGNFDDFFTEKAQKAFEKL